MINILITGSKGQLGSEIFELSNNYKDYTFFFTDKEELDITQFEVTKKFVIDNNIQVIINCAAYTNVDRAEDEPELAKLINVEATKNLAKIAKTQHLKFIHISTDYVFDGFSSEPYEEIDEVNPTNVYGITKLEGEKVLQTINPKTSIIVRTSWLYAAYGANFVKTILRLSKEKDEISVVNDQIGSPTYAKNLAKALLDIIPKINNTDVEVYHYANKGGCSWYEFATEIVHLSNEKCKVKPVTSAEFVTKAKRPNYSLLNTNKIEKTFNISIPQWKESLKDCFLRLKN